jgi:hypothetical protein
LYFPVPCWRYAKPCALGVLQICATYPSGGRWVSCFQSSSRIRELGFPR